MQGDDPSSGSGSPPHDVHQPQRGVSLPPGNRGVVQFQLLFTIHCVMWNREEFFHRHCLAQFRWWGAPENTTSVFTPITCPSQDPTFVENFLAEVEERAYVSALYPVCTGRERLQSYLSDQGSISFVISLIETQAPQHDDPTASPSQPVVRATQVVGETFVPGSSIPFKKRWFSIHQPSDGSRIASMLVSFELQAVPSGQQRPRAMPASPDLQPRNVSPVPMPLVEREDLREVLDDPDDDDEEDERERLYRSRRSGPVGDGRGRGVSRPSEDPLLDRFLANANALYADLATFESEVDPSSSSDDTLHSRQNQPQPRPSHFTSSDFQFPSPSTAAATAPHSNFQPSSTTLPPHDETDVAISAALAYDDDDFDESYFSGSDDERALEDQVRDILEEEGDLDFEMNGPRISADVARAVEDEDEVEMMGDESLLEFGDDDEDEEEEEGEEESEEEEEEEGEEEVGGIVIGIEGEEDVVVVIDDDVGGFDPSTILGPQKRSNPVGIDVDVPDAWSGLTVDEAIGGPKLKPEVEGGQDEPRTPPRQSTKRQRQSQFSPGRFSLCCQVVSFRADPSLSSSSSSSSISAYTLTARLPPSQQHTYSIDPSSSSSAFPLFFLFDSLSQSVLSANGGGTSLVVEFTVPESDITGFWDAPCSEFVPSAETTNEGTCSVRYYTDVEVGSIFGDGAVAYADIVVAIGRPNAIAVWRREESSRIGMNLAGGRGEEEEEGERSGREPEDVGSDVESNYGHQLHPVAPMSAVVVKIVEGCGFGRMASVHAGGLAGKIGLNAFVQFSLFSDDDAPPLRTEVAYRSFSPTWNAEISVPFKLAEDTYMYLESEEARFVVYHQQNDDHTIPIGYFSVRLERLLVSSVGVQEWFEVVSLEDHSSLVGMVFVEMSFDEETREVLFSAFENGEEEMSTESPRLLEMCRFGFIIEEMQVPLLPPPAPANSSSYYGNGGAALDQSDLRIVDYYIQYGEKRTRIYNTTAKATRIALHHASEVVLPFAECVKHLKDKQHEFELFRVAPGDQRGVYVGSCYVSLYPLFLKLNNGRVLLASHVKEYVLVQRNKSVLRGRMRIKTICEIMTESIQDKLETVKFQFDHLRATSDDLLGGSEIRFEEDDVGDDYNSILKRAREVVQEDEDRERRSLLEELADVDVDIEVDPDADDEFVGGGVRIRNVTHVEVQTHPSDDEDDDDEEGSEIGVGPEPPLPFQPEEEPSVFLEACVLSGLNLPPAIRPSTCFVALVYDRQTWTSPTIRYSDRPRWRFRVDVPVAGQARRNLAVHLWLKNSNENEDDLLVGVATVDMSVLHYGMEIDGWYVVSSDSVAMEASYGTSRPMVRISIGCSDFSSLSFDPDHRSPFVPSSTSASDNPLPSSTFPPSRSESLFSEPERILSDPLLDPNIEMDEDDDIENDVTLATLREQLNQSLTSLDQVLLSFSRDPMPESSSAFGVDDDEYGDDDLGIMEGGNLEMGMHRLGMREFVGEGSLFADDDLFVDDEDDEDPI